MSIYVAACTLIIFLAAFSANTPITLGSRLDTYASLSTGGSTSFSGWDVASSSSRTSGR